MKKELTPLDDVVFSHLEIEKMKRIKGGYTGNSVTVYATGGDVKDDGTAAEDDIHDD